VLNPLIPTGLASKSLGRSFVESDAFQGFTSDSHPRGVPSQKFITASPFERKALSTSEGFVTPLRDDRPVRTEQMQRLTIRNVLDVRPAGSGSDVDYITIDGGEISAEPVPKGQEKPEADISLDKERVKVETIAVTCPVDESDLQDIPGIVRLIDDELSYSLKVVEERQLLYGSGTSPELQGILTHSGVLETEVGGEVDTPQTLDFIAACQRDVRLAEFEPNFVAVHPEDWFQVVTLKNNQLSYIFSDPHVDPDGLRIWGMRVVVTKSAVDPETGARVILVGDGRRGATIYDRQQIAMQIGYVDKQFLLNKRTIRVEERLAFAIRAPLAFRKIATAAGAGTYGTGS
jgi:HK97 family phage major capsid protein